MYSTDPEFVIQAAVHVSNDIIYEMLPNYQCQFSQFFYFRFNQRADRRRAQGAVLLYLTQAAHTAAKTCSSHQHLCQCQHLPFFLHAGGRC